MPPPRDIFANFERMRRQMDELFGDVVARPGLAPRRRGFSPAVDVYYCGDPPRAVVKAELAGLDAESLDLEVRGREVVISGHRRPAEAEGRVYQQLEIAHGAFRRTISLGAEVDSDAVRATYENGILRVELPLREPLAQTRSVPIEIADESEG